MIARLITDHGEIAADVDDPGGGIHSNRGDPIIRRRKLGSHLKGLRIRKGDYQQAGEEDSRSPEGTNT